MARFFKKILCPVDFDDNSMIALDAAAELARENDATLYLLHVVFNPVGAPGFPLEPRPVVSEEPSKLQLEDLARGRLKEKTRHEVLVKIGKPAEVINETAEEIGADLVVMSTHGREGVARFFLGSVAEHVVRGSTRPVLTIRPPEKAGHSSSTAA
jgi:nucleotide-binding universal stress UspA family protein